MTGMLGWRPPEDRSHEDRYGLTATTMPSAPCPVVTGTNWYTAFDRPVKSSDGSYWIGREASWGTVRGGHAICLRPPSIADVASAWIHYNQGKEGACVGFASSRAATLFNRKIYSGFRLYAAAQTRDPWEGSATVPPIYHGTSVNAGLDTLRLEGAWPVRAGVTSGPVIADGIGSFLWARTVDEIMSALKSSEPFVRILNSWGSSYPREVRMPLAAVQRLLNERGEFGVPVDRPGQTGSKQR